MHPAAYTVQLRVSHDEVAAALQASRSKASVEDVVRALEEMPTVQVAHLDQVIASLTKEDLGPAEAFHTVQTDDGTWQLEWDKRRGDDRHFASEDEAVAAGIASGGRHLHDRYEVMGATPALHVASDEDGDIAGRV
jgi:hypothetical protein